MKKADIAAFFDRLAAALPEPKGELEYVNAYTLLVAVVLSAQPTDVAVNKATRALFTRVTPPQPMLEMGAAGLQAAITTIDLFNANEKNVIDTSTPPIAQ